MFDNFFDFFGSKPLIFVVTIFLSILKTVLDFVQIYLFRDWQFLIFLLVMVHLDTILGVWKAVKFKQVSSRGFAAYFEKLGMYLIFLIASHVLYNLPIEGKPEIIFSGIKNSSYVFIIVREFISLIESIGVIRPGLINPNILSYLKKFDASGKFSDLQTPNTNG